jgi:hypothetical protein
MDLREWLAALDRFPRIVLVTSLATGLGSVWIGLRLEETLLVGLGVVWVVGGIVLVRTLATDEG